MALANGIIERFMDQLQALVADSYYFRRIEDPNNAWDDATALAHVFLDAMPEPGNNEQYSGLELERMMPFAIVTDGDNGITFVQRANSPGCREITGQTYIGFFFRTPEEYKNDEPALARWFKLTMGRIIETQDDAKPGLWDLAGPQNRILIRRMICYPYERPSLEQRAQSGDHVFCVLEIEWGTG